MLSIKAKETQLVRSRSEAEASDAMCAQLRREMERLKRALTSAERASSVAMSPVATSPVARERDFSNGSDEAGIYRDTGMYGQEGRRTPGLYGGRSGYGSGTSVTGEEKENGIEARGKLRSPDLLQRGLARSGSTSSGRSPAREAFRAERREGSNTSSAGEAQPVESWKRAAEVTSALKAKIEQMKARI
jgi:cytoskeleton-associated protein 5